MPRNKSEALPKCAEAHAYADACEEVLAGQATSLSYKAWCQIPKEYRSPIDRSGPTGGRNWRSKRIAFIRENYAP